MATKREKTLYLLAGILAIMSGVRETFEGEYLKAAASACFALMVLLCTSELPGKPLWRRFTLYLLLAVQLGEFAYRLAVRSQG